MTRHGAAMRVSGHPPKAVYILNMREIWFVPFVNPDGYVANQAFWVSQSVTAESTCVHVRTFWAFSAACAGAAKQGQLSSITMLDGFLTSQEAPLCFRR